MPLWTSAIQPSQDMTGIYKLYLGKKIRGRNKATDFFHQFWCDLSEGGYKPTRADIRPSNLKQFLNRVVLMDVVPTNQDFGLKVKLIGTHVTAFYGELSGMDIHDMENKEAAKRIYKSCATMLKQSEPVLSVISGISEDKVHLEAYALYMPLYNDAGKIDKIMASVDIKSLSK